MNFEKNLVYFTGYPADHDNNKNEIMDQDDDDKYELKEIISAKLKGSIKFLFYLCTYLFSCVKKNVSICPLSNFFHTQSHIQNPFKHLR